MWLDPESLGRWMRPGDSQVVYVETHPVVGGAFRIDTQTDDGKVFRHSGEYLEIVRPHKLRFSWHSTVLDENPSEVTVEFHQQAEKCLMVLLHELPPDEAIFEDHRKGWAAVFDLFAQEQQSSER